MNRRDKIVKTEREYRWQRKKKGKKCICPGALQGREEKRENKGGCL